MITFRNVVGYLETIAEKHYNINSFHSGMMDEVDSTSWVDNDVVLSLPINAEPFTARFDNTLTGWAATLNIQVPNKNNLCISPIDPND